jgi:GTP-binding protein
MKPLALSFLKSAAQYSDLPPDNGFEIIIAGYSNVGKSSLINAIANIKNLAKCSKTPGRTQLFNIFTLDEKRRLMDLPGYGFAKVPGKSRQLWEARLTEYLSIRQCLKGVMIITDIRRGLRPLDIDLIEFCHQYELPLCIILNKADKLSKQACLQAKQIICDTLDIDSSLVIVTSCSKRTGIDKTISQLLLWLKR